MSSQHKIIQYLSSKLPPPAPHSIWTNPIHYIACGFGIGCIPIIPGTFATVAGIGLSLILAQLNLVSICVVLLILNILGIWLCGKTNRDFGCKDHPAACYDEIVTFPICMIGIPMTARYIFIAFILFRILDIFKPQPIRFIDKNVTGGLGVMLDDFVAALITLSCMHFLVRVPDLI